MGPSNVPPETLEDFILKAQSLIDTQAYFLDQMKASLQYIKNRSNVTVDDLLKASAYIYSHGGYNDLAINELRALISISDDNVHHKNKLAQVYIRRGKDGDYAKALEISRSVLNSASDSDRGDAWLCNHNAALASLALGSNDDAISYGVEALRYRDDPRTRAILDQARTPSASDIKFFSFASGEFASSGRPTVVAGMSRMEMI
ncbi:tetratricopeptide repeat protein [Xanthobacter wiegelii]|uniref:tetratricopeptide repeat protein n=1 Tax=Xanthobacter wiegelii TaxID=3119913 RepID=UPI00372B31B2